jgi:HEAT repeat protein
MAEDSKPRRKAFGPLFYTTATIAAIVLSIHGAMRAWGNLGAWAAQRAEAQTVQQLVVDAHDQRGDVRAQAFRSLLGRATTYRSHVDVDRSSGDRRLVPVFLAGSNDQDEDVRLDATRGLAVVASTLYAESDAERLEISDLCLDALQRLLDDPSPFVRNEALGGIAAFVAARGPARIEDRPAIVAKLRVALADADASVRLETAKIWLSIYGGRDPAVFETLFALLADSDPVVNRLEVATILASRQQAERASKVLVGLLESKDQAVLPDVLSCLGALGPYAKSALPALESLLADPNPDVRVSVGQAILAIEDVVEGENKKLTPLASAVVVKAVTDETMPMHWRMVAAETLLRFNSPALSSVAGVLVKQISNTDPAVRRGAVELLSMLVDQVRPDPPSSTPGP